MDLNLLVVFDTLMELRSATRTADRLSLTQPAISHALRRLRLATGDRLFERSPGGLQPTTRAWEMAAGVREGLAALRGAMAPTSFDPATAERRFVLAAGAYFCELLVPLLAERGRREAPAVSLHIVTLPDDLLAELDRGSIDIALGAFRKVPKRVVVEHLFTEQLTWVAAIHNPILKGRISAARLAAQPKIAISGARASTGHGDIVSEGGLDRQIGFAVGKPVPDRATDPASTVYDSQTAVAIVSRTDTVALVPRRSAFDGIEQGRLGVIDTVVAPPSIDLSMIWHRKQREDRGLSWLRGLINQAADDALSSTT